METMAFEIHNGYIYYPLALVLGYKFSMALITYFFPTAWEAPPPEAPKSRQGKKKFAKDADAQAKRAEMLARKQADADRKLAEARERD
ncbi:hypothetical protein BGZ94_009619 [Podila epigama]|nr:hypothetical protein BGZ94_009619 [Podila epigama]